MILVPRVSWLQEDGAGDLEQFDVDWDLGQVQSGVRSEPHVFYIFNNRGNVDNTVHTDEVPAMLNTRLSVRDYTGGTGSPTAENPDFGDLLGDVFLHNAQAITHGTRAVVYAKMYCNDPNLASEGQTNYEPGWGYFSDPVTWVPQPTDMVDEGNPGTPLSSEQPIILCAISGRLDEVHGNTPDIISGKVNNGTHTGPMAAYDNFAKIMMHLYPNDDAVSGEIKWRTRVSYQFY